VTSNEHEYPEAYDADLPHLSDGQVESLLRGHRPGDGPAAADRTADVLHALTGPGEPSELTGYRQAMAAYTDTFTAKATGQRPRRLVLLSSLLGVRALAGVAGSALAFGAVGAVVLTGSTLGPTHNPQALPLATGSTTSTASVTSATRGSDDAEDENDADGATSGSPSATTAVGPDASGPAAFGLCTAWSHHQAQGRTAAPGRSVAFRNLAEAAGGEDKIAGYCAKVPHPGSATTGTEDSGPSKDKATKAPKPQKPQKPSTPNGSGHGATPSARPTAPPRTTPSAPSLTKRGRPSVTSTS
jgi:hypothetical protein